MNSTLTTRRTFLASPLLLAACSSAPFSAPPSPRAGGAVTSAERLALPGTAEPFRAWLTLPRGYEADARQAWPLVVFLHGSGESGQDLHKVAAHGPPKHAAAGRDYPFVLCSPQLEDDREWEPTRLHALLAALQQRCRIDANRVLATGLSLGGHGVWNWAAAYPGDLAGIAPVCGFGSPAQVCRGRTVPVRAYHGETDDVVPVAVQQACVDALRACGGQVDFIVYPGVNHGAWEPAYEDPALVPWLMRQDQKQDQKQDRR